MQIIRPKLTPRQVWAKYGFPLVSKEEAYRIHRVRNNPDTATAKKYMGDGGYSISQRYRYLLDVRYGISSMCCDKLKKEPFSEFERSTLRRPILGIRADESLQRTMQYIKDGGCNVFNNMGRTRSKPLSIWTEKDILEYIQKYDVEIADVYLRGACRTGCVGCGFGAHRTDDKRFDMLYSEYPKYYEMVMNYTNNGVTYRDAVRELFDRNDKILPDEKLIL